MRTNRIRVLTYSLFSAVTLSVASSWAQPEAAPVGAPPPAEPLPPPQKKAAEDVFQSEDRPERPGKRLRIETHGPGNRLHVIERDADGHATHEFDSDESSNHSEKHIELSMRDDRPEKRVFRVTPDGKGDVVVRKFKGAKGPIVMDGGDDRESHLAEAIRHLHAAGMHADAERLERRMELPPPAPRFEARIDQGLRNDMEKLRQEQAKLQKELRKLQKSMAPKAPKEELDEKKDGKQ